MDCREPVLTARGLTALEVVIATAILGLLTAGFFSMLASQNRMLSDTIVDTHVQTDLRRTMDAVIEEIQLSRYCSISRVATPPSAAPYSSPPATGVNTLATLLWTPPPTDFVNPSTVSGDCYSFWLPRISPVRRDPTANPDPLAGHWVAGSGRVWDEGGTTNTAFGYLDSAGNWQNGSFTPPATITRASSIYWIPSVEPEDTISEIVFAVDINSDGDQTDVFQIGTLSVVRDGEPGFRRDLGRVACQVGQPRRIFTLIGAANGAPNIGEFPAWYGTPQTTVCMYHSDDIRRPASKSYSDNNANGRLDLVMEIRLMVIDASQAARDRMRMKVKQQTTRVLLMNTW